MSEVWDELVNSVESGALSAANLVGKAVDELVSMGVSAFSGIEWFVQYLIDQGQDPLSFIRTVVDRIESVGGDAISVLEEVVNGIRLDGIENFVKQKLNAVVQPIIEALQKQSTLGRQLDDVHQSTITMVQSQLDPLFASSIPSGLAFQGGAANSAHTLFTTISSNLKTLSTYHDEQEQINRDFISGLELIGAAAMTLALLDLVILACEAVVAVTTIGVAVPIEVTIDAGILAAQIYAILVLVAGDALIWLTRTAALLVATELRPMPTTDTPDTSIPPPPPPPPNLPPWLKALLVSLGGIAVASLTIQTLSDAQRSKLIDEIISLTGWTREEVEQFLRDHPDLTVEALLKLVKSGLTFPQIKMMLGRFDIAHLNAIAKINGAEALFKDIWEISDIDGIETLVQRLASTANSTAVGAGYLLQYAVAHKDQIAKIELEDGNGPDILLKDGTLIDTKTYSWDRYPDFLVDSTIKNYQKQIARTKTNYPEQPIKYTFDSQPGKLPQSVRKALEKEGVQVEVWPEPGGDPQ
jgi:hypothetical protein